MPLAASADGWRGKIGVSFTVDAAAKLADAAMHVLQADFGSRVLVAHDGRKASPQAAERILKVAAKRRCDAVYLARHIPTPIAASLLSASVVDIAFIITASHNSSEWNGVKIKAGRLGSVSGLIERQIDDRFRRLTGELVDDGENARGHHNFQADELVDEHCMQLMQRIGAVSWLGMLIVVDGLGGVAGKPVAQLCRRLGAHVIAIGDLVLETFGGIKPDPIVPESQQRCRDTVLTNSADLGIILDGDGDRVVLIGHNGEIWQSQELLAAMLDRLSGFARSRTDGPLLVTSATGSLIHHFADRQGREVLETAIGFKHIVDKMNLLEHSVGIGAVGDFGFQAYGSDRDPFAMLILLASAFPNLREIPVAIRNLKVVHGISHLQWTEQHWCPNGTHSLERAHTELLNRIAEIKGIEIPCVDGRKFRLGDGQWLMVRPSTTEGGIRIYGELHSKSITQELLSAAQAALDGVMAHTVKSAELLSS